MLAFSSITYNLLKTSAIVVSSDVVSIEAYSFFTSSNTLQISESLALTYSSMVKCFGIIKSSSVIISTIFTSISFDKVSKVTDFSSTIVYFEPPGRGGVAILSVMNGVTPLCLRFLPFSYKSRPLDVIRRVWNYSIVLVAAVISR